MEPGFAAPEIDTSRPHPARMYDAYLGGKDNYAVDREAVRQVLRAAPEVRDTARANRAFLQRAVRFLVGEAGIRQIIDVGTGIPAAGNVHQVAGEIAPGTRVAYVDNDPIVHVHANALLTGSGTTSIVLADLREPGAILGHPKVAELIDFGQPVALLLVAILHFVTDDEQPAGIIATFRDALPPGSYLCCRTGPVISAPRPPRRRQPCTTRPRLPRRCAATRRLPRCSRAGTWWSRAWSRCHCGGQTADDPARRNSARPGSTAASADVGRKPGAPPQPWMRSRSLGLKARRSNWSRRPTLARYRRRQPG